MKKFVLEPVACPQKMASYLKKQWQTITLIIISGTVYNAALSLGPIIQGKIIDKLLLGATFLEILMPVIIFVSVIAGIQIMRFMKRYYVRSFANKTSATMRLMVYNNIIHRDASVLSDESTGDLMTKAVSDVDACVEGMRKFITEVFDTGVLMVSYVVTMLFHDVVLTLCACAFIPVAMLIAEKLKKVIFGYTGEYRKQLSIVSEQTYETAENAMLYRIYSAEEQNLLRYNKELKKLEKKAILSNMLENSMQPIYNIIAMLGVFAVVLLGGENVLDGVWTVGAFSAYLTIFSALAIKAAKAAKLFNSVQKAQVSWKRIKPYLTEFIPDEVCEKSSEKTMELDVKNMSFRYPNALKTTLENVNFKAKSGDLIGITGAVASGKSTIGLALLGMYSYGGDISLNGKQLSTCSPREISEIIAYLGHDSQLLSDTIYSNITLGRDGDISKVLQDVCLDVDLLEMPDGINTMVGASGIRLSGGQQARLALARALHSRAKILVLDDPFSSVDMKTEKQIVANLREHYKNSIIILISHRISCFESANKVVLLENGTTICDTHKNLLKTSDTYRTIVAIQKEAN